MDGFAKELKYLIREALALKTGYPKTATALATKETDMTLSFSLSLPPKPPYNIAYFDLKTITANSSENMICAIYLNPDNEAQNYDMKGRSITIIPRKCGSQTVFDISGASTNTNDIDQLVGGRSVTLDYSFKIVGTSDYTVSIS